MRRYNTVLNWSLLKPNIRRRKAWEIEMAEHTLSVFGVARRGKHILGVGAGTEPTPFYLAAVGAEVTITDLYGGSIWTTAPADMLTNPHKYAPAKMEYDRSLIHVQHADMLALPFEANSFDGVFSSGSIEHVGTLEDVAQAAREIGRVLKPGGIASLSTEFKIEGKGGGWPNVLLLTEQEIWDYIITPSGLEPVDEPYFAIEQETIDKAVMFEAVIHNLLPHGFDEVALYSPSHGYMFTSVHLALRKPE